MHTADTTPRAVLLSRRRFSDDESVARACFGQERARHYQNMREAGEVEARLEPRTTALRVDPAVKDLDTCQELEDEDAELREQLETIIEAYDAAVELYRETIHDFWEWWWAILQPLVPEIPAQQRRRMYIRRLPQRTA
jgi:hypothetical protein